MENDEFLKAKLEEYYNARNTDFELSLDKPDPLFALKKAIDDKNDFIDEIAVICALLAYGSAREILKTLLKLDFCILGDERAILGYDFPLYRFQKSDDIKMLFLAMNGIIKNGGIKGIFVESYRKAKTNNDYIAGPKFPVICGINAMILALNTHIKKISSRDISKGLQFLIGRKATNPRTSSPLKRWNLFLRWLVRKDNIDLGIWEDCVSKADLILPLDTHTFRLSQKLGLLTRKSYDLQSAIEVTENLGRFCFDDPVKYDFALYRLGQERIL